MRVLRIGAEMSPERSLRPPRRPRPVIWPRRCVSPLKTVHWLLERRGGLALLDDPLMAVVGCTETFKFFS